MSRHDRRSSVTGRFERVPTENTALSADSKFDVVRELEVQTQPESYAYELVGRAENDADPRYTAPRLADDLGTGSPLRARRPKMVSGTDADHTIYGQQGAVLRSAARAGHDDMDPTRYLVGVEEVSDGRA